MCMKIKKYTVTVLFSLVTETTPYEQSLSEGRVLDEEKPFPRGFPKSPAMEKLICEDLTFLQPLRTTHSFTLIIWK